MTPNTDALKYDYPDADDDDAEDAPDDNINYSYYPTLIHLSLCNQNQNSKISPKTQNKT